MYGLSSNWLMLVSFDLRLLLLPHCLNNEEEKEAVSVVNDWISISVDWNGIDLLIWFVLNCWFEISFSSFFRFLLNGWVCAIDDNNNFHVWQVDKSIYTRNRYNYITYELTVNIIDLIWSLKFLVACYLFIVFLKLFSELLFEVVFSHLLVYIS